MAPGLSLQNEQPSVVIVPSSEDDENMGCKTPSIRYDSVADFLDHDEPEVEAKKSSLTTSMSMTPQMVALLN